jgi:hypothetical protein
MQWVRFLSASTALVELFKAIRLGLLDLPVELQGIPHRSSTHDDLQQDNRPRRGY